MSIATTLASRRHIAAANAAWIATIPEDRDQPWPYPTVEDYVQAALERVAESWVDSTGVDAIPVGQFVRRFTGSEFDAITSSTDSQVVAILAQLDAVPNVRLGAQTTVQALAYLVGAGLLTQARADAIGAFEVPMPALPGWLA